MGTRKLARLIQAMRPEELLVANLDDPHYLEILCAGNLDSLPALFAQNWKAGQAIRAERRKKISNHPIPIRKKNPPRRRGPTAPQTAPLTRSSQSQCPAAATPHKPDMCYIHRHFVAIDTGSVEDRRWR